MPLRFTNSNLSTFRNISPEEVLRDMASGSNVTGWKDVTLEHILPFMAQAILDAKDQQNQKPSNVTTWPPKP